MTRTTTHHEWPFPEDGDSDYETTFDTFIDDHLDIQVVIKGTKAERPSAGTADRWYLASDEPALYYDNGNSWDKIAGLDSTGENQTADRFHADLGSLSDPSFSFVGDTDTGMYSSSADNLRLVTGGTLALEVDGNQDIDIPNGDLTGTFYGRNGIRSSDQSISVPGDHATVQAAVDAAVDAYILEGAQSTISIDASTYNEDVVIPAYLFGGITGVEGAAFGIRINGSTGTAGEPATQIDSITITGAMGGVSSPSINNIELLGDSPHVNEDYAGVAQGCTNVEWDNIAFGASVTNGILFYAAGGKVSDTNFDNVTNGVRVKRGTVVNVVGATGSPGNKILKVDHGFGRTQNDATGGAIDAHGGLIVDESNQISYLPADIVAADGTTPNLPEGVTTEGDITDSGVTIWDSANAHIPEAALEKIYAALAEAETITGAWEFDTDISFANSHGIAMDVGFISDTGTIQLDIDSDNGSSFQQFVVSHDGETENLFIVNEDGTVDIPVGNLSVKDDAFYLFGTDDDFGIAYDSATDVAKFQINPLGTSPSTLMNFSVGASKLNFFAEIDVEDHMNIFQDNELRIGDPDSDRIEARWDAATDGQFELVSVDSVGSFTTVMTIPPNDIADFPNGVTRESQQVVTDGDDVTRDIYVIENGAADPASAGANDIIFEKEA